MNRKNPQKPRREDSRDPNLPLHSRLKRPNQIDRYRQHRYIGTDIKASGKHVEHLPIETLPWYIFVPHFTSGRAAEDGDEEGDGVEDRVEEYEELGHPPEDVAVDGEEDAEDEEEDGELDAGDGDAVGHVAVVG